MICKTCKKEIPDTARVCPNCSNIIFHEDSKVESLNSTDNSNLVLNHKEKTNKKNEIVGIIFLSMGLIYLIFIILGLLVIFSGGMGDMFGGG